MSHQRQRTRQTRPDYADIPPPTPGPEDSEYEDFQQQQLSASQRNSAVNLNAYAQSNHTSSTQAPPPFHLGRPQTAEEPIPSYSQTMQRSSSTGSLTMRHPLEFEPPLTLSRSSPSPPLTPATSGMSRPGVATAQYIADRAAAFTRKQNLKTIGLNFLNARQHLALTMCRDIVLILPLIHAFKRFQLSYELFHTMGTIDQDYLQMITTASPSEYFITGVWCLVAAYLSFNVIDGLMVRWIVTYQTSAAIVRVLSMSLFLITIELIGLSLFSPDGSYSLHTWILISLVLTGAYIIQSFVTSNLDLKDGNKRRRTIDYYSIAVFAVVPVGLASFISMIGLLRALLIIRLDLNGKALLDGLFP